MKFNPLHCIDFYKSGHYKQYPEGTTLVYSNFTPRSIRLSNLPIGAHDGKVVLFGLQYFIQDFLMEIFNDGFFSLPEEAVVAVYNRRMTGALGEGSVGLEHIRALHRLQYLPIEIKALPEGVAVNAGVPLLTIENTLPEFYWLTNYLETVLSCYMWKPCTSATTARYYKRLLRSFAEQTGSPLDFVDFQAHDFSFRGMAGLQDAAMSGGAHLVYFKGTDTVIALDFLEQYYNSEDCGIDFIGGSVPATEHSVMCAGGKETEIETFRRLICDVYPSGVLSIVSDTWDFWRVMTEYAETLKPEILARAGKVVFRPDSGDPIKIICGDPEAEAGSPAHKGALECLWGIYGGTVTEKGYRALDSHVGLIYGDSIDPARAYAILEEMKRKGFASCCIVLGIGSFTYEYVTRDTEGFAVKSTYVENNGEGQSIYKDPVTDGGTKKSAGAVIRSAG